MLLKFLVFLPLLLLLHRHSQRSDSSSRSTNPILLLSFFVSLTNSFSRTQSPSYQCYHCHQNISRSYLYIPRCECVMQCNNNFSYFVEYESSFYLECVWLDLFFKISWLILNKSVYFGCVAFFHVWLSLFFTQLI